MNDEYELDPQLQEAIEKHNGFARHNNGMGIKLNCYSSFCICPKCGLLHVIENTKIGDKIEMKCTDPSGEIPGCNETFSFVVETKT